jgi:hypothetical protein
MKKIKTFLIDKKFHSILQRYFILCVFLTYSIMRVKEIFRVDSFRIFRDSTNYFVGTSLPFFSVEFWLGSRSLMMYLLYKMFGVTEQSVCGIVVFQVFFSIACWGFLALQLYRIIRSTYLKPIAFIVVLVFSLHESINVGYSSS